MSAAPAQSGETVLIIYRAQDPQPVLRLDIGGGGLHVNMLDRTQKPAAITKAPEMESTDVLFFLM